MFFRIPAAARRRRWRRCLRGLLVAANQDPRLSRVFRHVFGHNTSVYLNIDRNKVQILKVNLSDVFQALQATLGGLRE